MQRQPLSTHTPLLHSGLASSSGEKGGAYNLPNIPRNRGRHSEAGATFTSGEATALASTAQEVGQLQML